MLARPKRDLGEGRRVRKLEDVVLARVGPDRVLGMGAPEHKDQARAARGQPSDHPAHKAVPSKLGVGRRRPALDGQGRVQQQHAVASPLFQAAAAAHARVGVTIFYRRQHVP
uniref:Uncharacterized protein n=1 Tax=Human herpesvirus 2 TaxID=10310 RepID=A0A481TFM9_HHV2|nr:hypothetical protein [Human alphaherpesvirus 2]